MQASLRRLLLSPRLVGKLDRRCPWCSGLACDPVKVVAAGSIPLGHPVFCEERIGRCLMDHLEKKFESMGARVKFAPLAAGDLRIDLRTDRDGVWFAAA